MALNCSTTKVTVQEGHRGTSAPIYTFDAGCLSSVRLFDLNNRLAVPLSPSVRVAEFQF